MQQMSTNQHERLAVETPEERETRLQQLSTNQRERLAVEAPEEREMRLQRMRDRLAVEIRGERNKITADEHQPA